tara:strand:- start:1062 stop:1430 length:369 start_codon:yes stop_codon:yes gene_type:complete
MKTLTQLLLIAALVAVSCFNADAQTKTEIEMEALPAAAHDLIHGKYAKYGVNSMLKKQDKNDVLTFEVELQKQSKLVTLTYNAEGTLLDTQKSKVFSFDGTEKPSKPSGGGGGGGGGGGHSH